MRALRVVAQRGVDGLADVGDRLEVRGPDLGVGQAVAPDKDLRLRLDPGLDLDLPLVGDRHRRGGDPLQQVGGRPALVQELPVRAVVRQAVPALRRADDRAARPHDLGGGRHALHGLVEVLVERIAAVGRDHDVEWRRDGAASPRAAPPRRRPRASRGSRRRRPG